MTDIVASSPSKAITPTFESNLDMALHLANAGMYVFPCESLGTEFEKSPLITGHRSDGEAFHLAFSKYATTNEMQIVEWWSEHPTALIGIHTGPSGIVCIDLDEKDGKHGISQFEKLQEEYGKLPSTPSQRTPSGGMHIIVGATENTVKMMSNSKDGDDGIDIRSENYYFCTGIEYTWQSDLVGHRTDCPTWLIDWTRKRKTTQKKNGKVSAESESKIFHKGKLPEPDFPEGVRNENLFSRASAYRAQGMEENQIFALLQLDNEKYCEPPLSESELHSIAHSAARYEAHRLEIEREEAKSEVKAKNRAIIHTAADALKPQPPIEFTVQNLFTIASVNLLVGKFGEKKTWCVQNLGACVAEGNNWLGLSTKQGKVLFVDEESGKRRMFRRLSQVLRGIGGDEYTPFDFISLAQFNLRAENDVNELWEIIDEGHYSLVIIDTLADVMVGGDENSVKDVQPVFMNLRAIAEATGATIIVIHHLNKGGDFRGSTAIAGAIDTMLQVESKPDTAIVKFTTLKVRDGEPLKFTAEALWEDDTFKLEVREGAFDKFTDEQVVALQIATEKGLVSPDDLVNQLGISISKAKRALYGLVSEGKVRRANPEETGRGVKALYEVTKNESV